MQTIKINIQSIKHAREITSGDISTENSKLLGTSFGLSPWHCKTGAKLSKIEASVCSQCYAKRGSGIYPTVKQGRENNTLAIRKHIKQHTMDNWRDAMIYLIDKRCKIGFHRWHDAGDLQGLDHFVAIVEIAEALPHIKFWLPTKESKIIKNYKGFIPDNFCVRLSGSMVDGLPPKVDSVYCTSTVHKNATANGYVCPAPTQGNNCGSCTACYNRNIKNVSYHKH